jgi:hypothetical protein
VVIFLKIFLLFAEVPYTQKLKMHKWYFTTIIKTIPAPGRAGP